MQTNLRITVWLSSCACLVLLTLGVFWWLSLPRSSAADLPTLATNPTLSALLYSTAQTTAVVNRPRSVTTSKTAVANSQPAPLSNPPLPPVPYPLGSIGEACEVNTYPPITLINQETALNFKNSPFDSTGEWKLLKEPKCRTALEKHMNSINPYLWGKKAHTLERHHIIALVIVDNPLTFERIFTDPAGDFARLQETLARPECHPENDTQTNWNLNKPCHGDAIFNHALFSRFCNDHGVTHRPRPTWDEDRPTTPEQDRSMWIESLEDTWVLEKCKGVDQQNLNLRLPVHTELRQQIQKLQISDENSFWGTRKTLDATLIDLAARLGDDAAGLTYPFFLNGDYDQPYSEEGYKYGLLAEWFTTVFEPAELFTKHPPSADRLRQLVTLFGKNIKVKGKLIRFNHEVLVQHLCTPPYYTPPSVDEDPTPEPPSCREIVYELRQETLSPAMLDAINTFEDVAVHLDVYE